MSSEITGGILWPFLRVHPGAPVLAEINGYLVPVIDVYRDDGGGLILEVDKGDRPPVGNTGHLWTVADVSEYTNLSEATIRHLVQKHPVELKPAIRLWSPGVWRRFKARHTT